jgi:hypothetical protein
MNTANNYEFHIRGDASFVLMEMTQQALTAQFERAHYDLLISLGPFDNTNNLVPTHPYPVLSLARHLPRRRE